MSSYTWLSTHAYIHMSIHRPTATIGLDHFGMRHKTASFAYTDWRDPEDWPHEGGPAANDEISVIMDDVVNASQTGSNKLPSHFK